MQGSGDGYMDMHATDGDVDDYLASAKLSMGDDDGAGDAGPLSDSYSAAMRGLSEQTKLEASGNYGVPVNARAGDNGQGCLFPGANEET